jgi:hypothetical protein
MCYARRAALPNPLVPGGPGIFVSFALQMKQRSQLLQFFEKLV